MKLNRLKEHEKSNLDIIIAACKTMGDPYFFTDKVISGYNSVVTPATVLAMALRIKEMDEATEL